MEGKDGHTSYGFHWEMKESSKYCISDAQYKAKYYISEHITNYSLNVGTITLDL